MDLCLTRVIAHVFFCKPVSAISCFYPFKKAQWCSKLYECYSLMNSRLALTLGVIYVECALSPVTTSVSLGFSDFLLHTTYLFIDEVATAICYKWWVASAFEESWGDKRLKAIKWEIGNALKPNGLCCKKCLQNARHGKWYFKNRHDATMHQKSSHSESQRIITALGDGAQLVPGGLISVKSIWLIFCLLYPLA